MRILWKPAGVLALVSGVTFAGAAGMSGQQPQAPPRLEGASPTDGPRVYGTLCASCHGQAGEGGRGPAVAGNRRLQIMSDEELQNLIRNGTPNGMPGFASLPPDELEAVTAFVRSLNAPLRQEEPDGNVSAGEVFFFGQGECASCHLVLGRGSPAGPDLSHIGEQMTLAEMKEALLDPSATVAEGYATVSVQSEDGRALRGFARNEGNHVLALQTLDGRLTAFDKRSVKVTRESGSIMPALRASATEQRDLLAYLMNLRGGRPPERTDAPAPTASAFEEIQSPRPGDWPTYHGRLNGNRYSAHEQINTANVGQLSLQWVHSLRSFDIEMSPLVLDGIMYITGPNQVSALDATSGREIWRYSRPRTPGLRGDAARGFNRGVAVLGERVFFVTDNAHLLALSRVNGALLWEVVLPEKPEMPYGGTMAPLVVGDLVIAGVSGGDEGIRGFLAAYHVSTGKQAWRFWTVPLRGEAGSETWQGDANLEEGGGATWLTGTYDPDTGTLYWPTGNPYPDTDGSGRQGDNLYTNCILALDVKTGQLRWHYQFTPHDLWDWDAQSPPLLIDAPYQGRPRKLLLQANRNGFFYVLDRTNGDFLGATPFVEKLTWASGIGPDGRPRLLPGNVPDEEGVTTCPAIRGATNWMSSSYSPQTGLFYVMAVENCFLYRSTMFGGGRRAGAGRAPATPPSVERPANRRSRRRSGSMALRALDIETGRVVWEVPQTGGTNNYAGTLSTAGGVVFYGQATGEFAAVDAKNGSHLWHFETQEPWKASPITYMVNGRQYVAIASGANVLAFALPRHRSPR
ncbi:MAG: PQQ-binding-like beta-propeller repeat protein [Luteitalea sp.]|nr:PQQ-binding-like beta-propeller repeat protein [Luteitalea sp.]